MAQKVQVMLLCDLCDDETEAAETLAFAVDGASYELDVCADHAEEIREAFATYVGSARRAGRGQAAPARRGRPARSSRAGGNGDKDRVAEIREWARQNGHQVSERGRLSAVVVGAYEAAH